MLMLSWGICLSSLETTQEKNGNHYTTHHSLLVQVYISPLATGVPSAVKSYVAHKREDKFIFLIVLALVKIISKCVKNRRVTTGMKTNKVRSEDDNRNG